MRIEAETDPDLASNLRGERELHHRRAERNYQQLAQGDPSTDAITFDLQQSLPTPILTTNIVYYKMQLWTYNSGIHFCATGVGYIHMWSEQEASRGSQDIGTCVRTFLDEHQTPAKTLILSSDSYGGQNLEH